MHTRSIVIAAVLGAAGSVCAVQSPWRRSTNDTASDGATKRFIIELKSNTHFPQAAEKIASLPGLNVLKRFDSDLFPGLSVECSSRCDRESVKEALDDSDNVEDDQIVAAVYTSSPMQLLPTVEGESFSDDAAAQNYSVHGSTGVEELHQKGILGKGAIVAIVDSGVQYTHPALGGGFGPEYTVIGGYDLVGASWPATSPQPDNDPMDTFGHGTHVAGIIAGKSEQFVGVAPDAKLLSFRVIGAAGYSDEDMVIQGFLAAFESGADIISASLGETSGFTNNAWAVVASRMVDQGVVVVIAGGNDGQDGPFSASNGASGKDVLTVASADPGVFPAQAFSANFTLDGVSNETQVAYVPKAAFFPQSILGWPIKPLTLNSSVADDACVALPAGTPNITNAVVLVRLGGCTVGTKHSNLAAIGAQYILFYNDASSVRPIYSSVTTGAVGLIEATAGISMVDTIAAGGNVTVSFDLDTSHYVGIYNAGGGRPASYTTWGGTYDLALKPEIAAPGTKILSTYPTDAYYVLSGTSMATPYIAGIAALWVGQHGGRSAHADDPEWARRLIARIISTARAMPWADWNTADVDYGFWAPGAQVGAGLVDAVRVLEYSTLVSFEGRKFELNDTANFVGSHSVDITNSGSEPITYSFALQDYGGYESWYPKTPGVEQTFVPSLKLYVDVVPVKMVPEVAMPQGEFTVGAGETKTAEFTFKVPDGLNASKLPVYSGRVLIRGSNGEELGIPYFGIACDLKQTITNLWDYGASFPTMVSGITNIPLARKSNFTFNLTQFAQDFPRFNTKFTWGTSEFRWDIFEANYTEADWTYPTVVGQNGYVGSATSWNGTSKASWFDPNSHSEDDIFSFPIHHQPRAKWGIYFWLGRLANGSDISPGLYKFRAAALRPFGDPQVATDWDVWSTPDITVLPLV